MNRLESVEAVKDGNLYVIKFVFSRAQMTLKLPKTDYLNILSTLQAVDKSIDEKPK